MMSSEGEASFAGGSAFVNVMDVGRMGLEYCTDLKEPIKSEPEVVVGQGGDCPPP